jgi:hypothetical protein
MPAITRSWPGILTGGDSGEIVRQLMLACVAQRLGHFKASHHLEGLSDNSSACTAKETLDSATTLGLCLLFAPVRSPQSTRISEAFVKNAQARLLCPIVNPTLG